MRENEILKGKCIDINHQGHGVIKFDTYALAYGKKWVFGYFNGSSTSLKVPDAMVSYEIPSGTYSDYQFKYLAVKLAESTDKYSDYILVEVWNKNTSTLIDCAVLNYDCDIANGDYLPMAAYLNDITFELNEGATSVSDTTLTSCVVKQNGAPVLNVTYSSNVATIEKVS